MLPPRSVIHSSRFPFSNEIIFIFLRQHRFLEIISSFVAIFLNIGYFLARALYIPSSIAHPGSLSKGALSFSSEVWSKGAYTNSFFLSASQIVSPSIYLGVVKTCSFLVLRSEHKLIFCVSKSSIEKEMALISLHL